MISLGIAVASDVGRGTEVGLGEIAAFRPCTACRWANSRPDIFWGRWFIGCFNVLRYIEWSQQTTACTVLRGQKKYWRTPFMQDVVRLPYEVEISTKARHGNESISSVLIDQERKPVLKLTSNPGWLYTCTSNFLPRRKRLDWPLRDPLPIGIGSSPDTPPRLRLFYKSPLSAV